MTIENSTPVVVRMPPSPTGHLHLGTARAALFNWLFAKKNNGKIVFRWEDTDRERSKSEFEREIFDGLAWLGMDFEHKSDAVFRQTECAEMHAEFLKKLWNAEKVFPCFTTPDELEKLRTNTTEAKTGFVFWSPWRDLPRDEAETKMQTEKFVWRLKVPKNQWIVWKDLIRKKISVNSDTIGDFAVARGDGSVLYYLANVLDDWQQGITHVLRGEDHVPNTPKQILLYEALDAPLPIFGHIPLVLDSNKKKLSKRTAEPGICVLVNDFREAGFLPEAVVNGLVFLGWNPKSTEEIFSMTDLEKRFEISQINSAAAQYDFKKMVWFNAQWMRRIEVEKLQQYFFEFSEKTIAPAALQVAREKARSLVELQDELKYLVADPGCDTSLLGNEKWGLTTAAAQAMLGELLPVLKKISANDWSRNAVEKVIVAWIKKTGRKNGEVLWPLRIALANRRGSAGPFDIAGVITRDETIRRIERAHRG